MYAYLVRSAGLKSADNEGRTRVTLGDLPVCYRVACAVCRVAYNSHFFAVYRMSAYRCINSAGVLMHSTAQQRNIRAADCVFLDICGKRCVGCVVFGDNEQTGGIFVNAVDDSGTHDPADPGKAASAMRKKGIHKCTVRISRRRMHDHS